MGFYNCALLGALVAGRLVDCASPPSYGRGLNTNDLATRYFGNDSTWYLNRVPYFECSDGQIQETYYYRWKIFRAHQRDIGEQGFVSTEFLNDVSWQLNPFATLNDATGFHIGEGRWLRDRRFVDDYIRYMYNGGNDRHFTEYLEHSVYGRYLVDGDKEALTTHMQAMIDIYNQWDDSLDKTKGLYFREPLYDATEYTISSIDASGGADGFFGGTAFRPSINSYMWSKATAIAATANLAGNTSIAADFTGRALALKTRFQADIWNSTLQHFIDRYQITNEYVKYWEPIRGRELVGLVPWMFNMPDDNSKYTVAWEHLLDPTQLQGVNGMRTNEPSYEYYMRQYRYDDATGLRECQWNGPVWPFQTTQTLLGMANLLNSYTQSIVKASDYLSELRKYTKLHYVNNTQDLQEDYEPDKAGPIVGLPRSHHYFHSGYIDLIVSGLVGIRPRNDSVLEVNPLIPSTSGLSYFRLQDVLYHGHSIAVQWDSDGSRYGGTRGLQIEVDGKVVVSSKTIKRLKTTLSPKSAPSIERRISKSVQLNIGKYPIGSASIANDTNNVHGAIDGRIMFFPEEANGWNSNVTSAKSNQWFAIDFGTTVQLTACDLAFYVDGSEFVLPSSYKIQKLVGSQWQEVWKGGPGLVANGVTSLSGSVVSTSQVRLAFVQPAGKRVRLVEFKTY